MDSQGSFNRFTAIAKRLTSMGIRICPTYPGYNGAAFSRWTTEATTNMDTVQGWMTNGYTVTDRKTNQPKQVVVDYTYNWVCVAGDNTGCADIDDLKECEKLGMPPIPADVFTVDTPSGGQHVPFLHDDRTRKLGNIRNVEIPAPITEQPDRTCKVFEWKGKNAAWCAPWQFRYDGGYYKPRNSKAPLWVPSDEHLAWIERHAGAKSKEPNVKTPFTGFHPTHDPEAFLEHFDTTEHQSGMMDTTFCVVPESTPCCGRDAKDTTIPGAIAKFFFNGNYWDYFCNACGKKRSDLEDEYGTYDYIVFESEDKSILTQEDRDALAVLGVEEADGECSPCIHLGENSNLHTRGETLGKVYTQPTLEPKKLPDFYPVKWSEQQSDKGNAELLARYYGFDILFVPEAGSKGGYFVWTGTHWEHDKGNVRLLTFTKQLVGILLVHASKQEDDEKRADWAAYAFSFGNVANMKSAIELVRTHVRVVHKSEFNNNRMLFNVTGGTVNLTTGQIRPHDRDDLLTKCQSVVWDVNAECKRWEQYLDEIFEGNKDITEWIQRAVGYTMTGLTIEEILFVGYGTGRNGKGKFTDTLIALLGDYARPAKFDMFVAKKGDEGKANDIAELFGARFVPASEGEQSKRLAEAKIKNMVSGDPVEGEKKYQDSFTYYPEYKIWLFTNYKPRIVGTDEGIWDKVVFVPFKRYFKPEERDRRLLDKLKAELPGILQWAIRGCLAWQQRGLVEFMPDCLKEATDQYRKEQNVLGHFIEDELVENPKLKSPCGLMYERYTDWAEKNGEYQMTSTEFKDRMEQRYGEAGRSRQGKFWKGVGIKQLLSEEDKWMLEGRTVEEMEAAIQ